MDWGTIGVAALNGLGNVFGRRSERKQSKEDWKRQLEMQRNQFAADRAMAEGNRRWELEDRRFAGDAIGNYAQFYGGPQVERPSAPISTEVTPIETPQALQQPTQQQQQPKKKKKKRGLLGRVLGGVLS